MPRTSTSTSSPTVRWCYVRDWKTVSWWPGHRWWKRSDSWDKPQKLEDRTTIAVDGDHDSFQMITMIVPILACRLDPCPIPATSICDLPVAICALYISSFRPLPSIAQLFLGDMEITYEQPGNDFLSKCLLVSTSPIEWTHFSNQFPVFSGLSELF